MFTLGPGALPGAWAGFKVAGDVGLFPAFEFRSLAPGGCHVRWVKYTPGNNTYAIHWRMNPRPQPLLLTADPALGIAHVNVERGPIFSLLIGGHVAAQTLDERNPEAILTNLRVNPLMEDVFVPFGSCLFFETYTNNVQSCLWLAWNEFGEPERSTQIDR